MIQKKVVKPQIKGMVTIPSSFRETLGITPETPLIVELKNNGVFITKFIPVSAPQPKSPLYSEMEIREMVKTDKIDPKTAKKLKKLLS